jgi:hypothetical protein
MYEFFLNQFILFRLLDKTFPLSKFKRMQMPLIILLIFLIKMVLSPPNDAYLTHSWSFDNSQMRDQVGSADMSQGNLTSFASDRFGNVNSALVLNGGWTKVPTGIYFNTLEFSITVWVLPQQVNAWSRVIDFGNGQTNNVYLSLDHGFNQKPFFVANLGQWEHIGSSQALILNQWQHLAATFKGSTMNIYINGTLTASKNFSTLMPQSLSRSNCYVGRSNWVADGFSSSILDDLRFYNKSLSQNDIVELMNMSCEYK